MNKYKFELMLIYFIVLLNTGNIMQGTLGKMSAFVYP